MMFLPSQLMSLREAPEMRCDRSGLIRTAAVLLATVLIASASGAQDHDGDGVQDAVDNCLEIANPAQANHDFDRFGDACDGDVDQSGTTDAVDRKHVTEALRSSRPRALADFDSSGRADSADLAVFDAKLVGSAPGPAGPRAHDQDGDGLLDHCARPDREPALEGTLPNGSFDQGRAGWKINRPYVAFTRHQGHARAGAVHWLTWGGGGHGNGSRCGGSCVQPEPLPVEVGSTYAYSFYTCVPTFPPATLVLAFAEYDSGGGFLGLKAGLNTSKILNSGPGIWEENVVFYQPSDDRVVEVQPKLFRKSGPTLARGSIFADDFSFRVIEPDVRRAGSMAPSPKRAFEGARTRVDELGNLRVLDEGGWRDIIPFGIYVNLHQDYRVYVDAGFDVAMNERGFGAEAGPAIDARSDLVPDGMRFMFIASRWGDAPPGGLTFEKALQNLRSKTSPRRGIRLWNRLLAFNYDNEVFTRCATWTETVQKEAGQKKTRECLVPMWQAERTILARLFQVDREENGGNRGVPTYFLNGNLGVARAFAGRASAVDSLGSVRADTTGSYGASSIHDLEMAQNQLAPTLIVQVQGHMGDRFRPIAFGGLALGAKMIGVWRDWAPVGKTYGRVRVAPELRLCSPKTLRLRARERHQNPRGQILQGSRSGALAEVLDGPRPFAGCRRGETGSTFRVHRRRGVFQPGETLLDAATGERIPGARVKGSGGEDLVDYEVSIAERGWYQEVPNLRREVDALAPILRASHLTDWSARIRARTDQEPAHPVSFGDAGIIWGTRTHQGRLYLLLSNTAHRLDPYREWDHQFVGQQLDLEIELEHLPTPVVRARRFDRQTLRFTEDGAIPVENGRLKLSLPPFGSEVLEFEASPGL